MVMGPVILILDELAAQLDLIKRENFFRNIKKINDELGITALCQNTGLTMFWLTEIKLL